MKGEACSASERRPPRPFAVRRAASLRPRQRPHQHRRPRIGARPLRGAPLQGGPWRRVGPPPSRPGPRATPTTPWPLRDRRAPGKACGHIARARRRVSRVACGTTAPGRGTDALSVRAPIREWVSEGPLAGKRCGLGGGGGTHTQRSLGAGPDRPRPAPARSPTPQCHERRHTLFMP